MIWELNCILFYGKELQVRHIKWIFSSNPNMQCFAFLLSQCYELKNQKRIPPLTLLFEIQNPIYCVVDLICYYYRLYHTKVNFNLNDKLYRMLEIYALYHTEWMHYTVLKSTTYVYEEEKSGIYCGNKKCQIRYCQHKYGCDVNNIEHKHKSPGVWYCKIYKKNKTPINKWYICKGCKFMYYCSRKCQKYAWNKLN
eukprot:9476_1